MQETGIINFWETVDTAKCSCEKVISKVILLRLMTQSWGDVASMHDHLLILITVHAHPLVPCAYADGSGCRGHIPPTKCAMVTFSLSRSARTLLPDY